MVPYARYKLNTYETRLMNYLLSNTDSATAAVILHHTIMLDRIKVVPPLASTLLMDGPRTITTDSPGELDKHAQTQQPIRSPNSPLPFTRLPRFAYGITWRCVSNPYEAGLSTLRSSALVLSQDPAAEQTCCYLRLVLHPFQYCWTRLHQRRH